MQFENNEDSCDAQILTRIIFYSQVYECFRESHPRAVALVEDCCCFRYAANAIEAPLASRYRAVSRFQKTD
jgi:hypothetical protein